MKRFLLLAAAAMSLAACSLEVADPYANGTPSDPATETFAAGLKIDLTKYTKTAAGTYYLDVKVGTGPELGGSDVIIVSYRGLLKDGSQFAEVGDATATLSQMVGGLQDAMPGMRVGGERIIIIPSELGFGRVPFGSVPANSTLIFDVLLKGIP